jgi:mannosyltransferase
VTTRELTPTTETPATAPARVAPPALDARGLVLPEAAVPARAAAPEEPVARPGRIVAVLTAVALVLRLALVGAQSIWLDEALTLRQASMPLGDMWRFQLTQNVHVPLYHTIVHYWIGAFGTGLVSLRMPSVLCGTAAVPLLYLVGRRLLGTRVGVVGAAVGTAAPFWVWHGDEARMYPLMILTGLVSLVALFRAHDRGGAGRWALYALVTGVSFYSHYFVVLMVPVHLLWLLLQRPARGKVLAWFAAAAGAGALLAPWLVALYLQRIGVAGAPEFSNNARDFLYGLDPFSIAYAMITFVAVFVTGYHSAATLTIVSGLLVGLWPLAALAVSVRRRVLSSEHARNALFLVGWLVLQVAGGFVIDLVKPGAWFQKYHALASVPALLLLAMAVSRLSRRLVAVVVVPVLLLGAVSVSQNVETDNPVRQDWESAVAAVERGFRPGDAVVVMPGFNVHPFDYYWHDRTPIWGVLSHSHPVRTVIDRDLPTIAAGHPGATMWVVSIHGEGYDPHGEVRTHLQATFPLLERHEFTTALIVEAFRLPDRPVRARR